jgi:phosphocarrier protein
MNAPPSSDGSRASGTVTRILKIINEKGLHARASAKFVVVVEKFKDSATIQVSKGEETVSGDSIMGLMMLGAGIGSSISISASGTQAKEAVDALAALVSSKFGEEE